MAKRLDMYAPQSAPVEILRDLLLETTPEIIDMRSSELNRVGVAEGIITGGELSVMYGLRCKKFDIKPEGKILFIEDLCEEPYHIDRMMQNLRISGILAKISGLMVGRFTDINDDPSFGQSVEEIISSSVSGYSYPVAFNLPVGHVDYNIPIISGHRIRLTVDSQQPNFIYLE